MSVPAANEIEISVFGRGSGEAIAVHVGEGRWLLIDSLLSNAGTPVALDYFDEIGVDYGSVEAILLTHWHDDHIAGASFLAHNCPNAIVSIPATLQSDEFIGFIEAADPVPATKFGSGVTELRRVLEILKGRGTFPHWGIAQRRISGGANRSYEFEALSPSNADLTEFYSSISQWLKTHTTGDYLPRPQRNDSSVASVVQVDEQLLLFGADLEVAGARTGWAALESGAWNNRGKASFVKIPHHGSKNAHYPPMWTDMSIPHVYSALTPWNKNKGLPTKEDAERICAITDNAFAASVPLSRKSLKRMPSVDSILRSKGVKIFRDDNDVGHVRFRCSTQASAQWKVDLFGVGSCKLLDLAA